MATRVRAGVRAFPPPERLGHASDACRSAATCLPGERGGHLPGGERYYAFARRAGPGRGTPRRAVWHPCSLAGCISTCRERRFIAAPFLSRLRFHPYRLGHSTPLHISPGAVAGWVASYVVKRIKAFNPTAERPFVLGELVRGAGFCVARGPALPPHPPLHISPVLPPRWPLPAGLPTGSSPLQMYKKLIEMHKAGEISFANVITFK